MDENKQTVAVLGLGLIGSVWAKHLEYDGLLTAAWNRTEKTSLPRWVESPSMAARKANVLIVVVADPSAVESVISGMLPSLTSKHLVIQSSTIGPEDSARMRALVEASGARYLEAPFTGSRPAAEARKTIFYLGGDAEVAAMAEPVLSHISAQRIRIGTGEQACAIKLAMNLQIATQAEALCEAIYLTRRAGIRDDTFFECMKGNASWSGLSALKEPKLRANDYDPQFSVKHLLKDLRLLERHTGTLPSLTMMIRQLEAATDAGRQDKDFISLYQNLENKAPE
ncbi:MAG TPA: NAD(P)-dependent oxidoreductase [Kiritimatiellia bacterium]|nr:NAD(P)-dependent oxidoreductase [Kiritimatiellia bacterium]